MSDRTLDHTSWHRGGAAIGYAYGDEDNLDPQAQQLHDENLLASYLGEGEGEKEQSEDSEYGESPTLPRSIHPSIPSPSVHIHAEIDIDVDSFKPYEIDRMNVLALDFGLQAGAFSRYAFMHVYSYIASGKSGLIYY